MSNQEKLLLVVGGCSVGIALGWLGKTLVDNRNKKSTRSPQQKSLRSDASSDNASPAAAAAKTTPFQTAADLIASTGSKLKLTNEEKLQLYALFKQATVGPCNTPKPSSLDFAAAMKWDAWTKCGSMSSTEAEKRYIALSRSLLQRAMKPSDIDAALGSSTTTEESQQQQQAAAQSEAPPPTTTTAAVTSQQQQQPHKSRWNSVEEFRAFVASKLQRAGGDDADEEGEIEDACPNGIAIRIYKPKKKQLEQEERQQRRRLPVLIYFHSGGWIAGDLSTDDTLCRFLARAVDCVVVSVQYSLAPESPFSIGLENCFEVSEWVFENLDLLNGDPDLVGVAGYEAGANLAAGLARMNKDVGSSPFAFQLLLCPPLSNKLGQQFHSHNEFASSPDDDAEDQSRLPLLSSADWAWLWDQYLASAAAAAAEEEEEEDGSEQHQQQQQQPAVEITSYSCPLEFTEGYELHGLPRTFIVTAQRDPLRDEGELYAERLLDAARSQQRHGDAATAESRQVTCLRLENCNHNFAREAFDATPKADNNNNNNSSSNHSAAREGLHFALSAFKEWLMLPDEGQQEATLTKRTISQGVEFVQGREWRLHGLKGRQGGRSSSSSSNGDEEVSIDAGDYTTVRLTDCHEAIITITGTPRLVTARNCTSCRLVLVSGGPAAAAAAACKKANNSSSSSSTAVYERIEITECEGIFVELFNDLSAPLIAITSSSKCKLVFHHHSTTTTTTTALPPRSQIHTTRSSEISVVMVDDRAAAASASGSTTTTTTSTMFGPSFDSSAVIITKAIPDTIVTMVDSNRIDDAPASVVTFAVGGPVV